MNSWRIRQKGLTANPTASAPPRRTSSIADLDPGFSVVSQGRDPIVADFIAVHGLNGHWEKTWSTTSSKVNWLRTILPEDIPNVRILTYGYNSRTHGFDQLISESLYDYAKDFVRRLCVYRSHTKTEKRPIIFLAHSLGGIVVKAALIHSSLTQRDNQDDIKRSTCGLVCFGTPHGGSSIASLGTNLLQLASPFAKTNSRIIRHLQEDSEWLRMQNDQFAEISSDFDIVNFFETYCTHIVWGKEILIVPEQSATRVGKTKFALQKNHTELVRFENRSDPAYLLVRSCLLDLVNKVSSKQSLPTFTSTRTPPDTGAVDMGGVFSSASSATVTESADRPRSTAAVSPSEMIVLPFLLPVQQNPDFVGREVQLKQMHDHLYKSDETPASPGGSKSKIVVLFGMGGAGKTQLSLAFAEHHKNDFDVVLWVDASSERNTFVSFRNFAQRLLDSRTGGDAHKTLLARLHLGEYVSATGHVSSDDKTLPNVARCVVEFLQTEGETFTWLMVLDNLDDPDYPLTKYLPQNKHRGKVIITTRATAVTRFGQPIEVADIDEESGIKILLNAAYMRNQSHTDTDDARLIAQALGYLPLALEQAGAYISTTQMQLSKYLGLLERHQRDLLNSPRASTMSGDQKSVFATFEVSYKRLFEQNQDAAELLTLLCFLHNSSVWEGLLLPASELRHRPQRQNSMINSTQTHGPSRPDTSLPELYTNEFKLENDLGAIFSVSLAKRNSPNGAVYIHPLVHTWGRTRLSLETHQHKLVQAVTVVGRALEAAYTRPITNEIRNFISRIVPHADQVINLISQQDEKVEGETISLTFLKSSSSARALFYLGVLFQNISRLKEAETIFTSIISSASSAEETITPVMVANARRRLAQIMILYSRYTEAEQLLEVAIPVLELQLGKVHEDTVTAMLELGMVYHRRHEYSRAETHLREVILSGTNPITGRMGRAAREASSILALVYRHLGRVKEALDILTPALEQALAPTKSTSSSCYRGTASPTAGLTRSNSLQYPSPPQSPTSQDNQDEDTIHQGDEEPDDQSPAHLSTLQYRYAILLQELGLWLVAMARYQTVHSSLSSILGANHPMTLRTANALGRIYCFLGKYKESREMLDLAWKGQQQLGFSKDAETAQLRTLFNIGVLNREEGLYAASEDCLGRVEEAYKWLFPVERDPNTDDRSELRGAQEVIPKLKFPVQDVMLEKAITLTYMARYSSSSSSSSSPTSPVRLGFASPETAVESALTLKEERLNKATNILKSLLASQEEHDKTGLFEHVTTRAALAEAYLEYRTPEGLKLAEEAIRLAGTYVTSQKARVAGLEGDNPIRLRVELVGVEILLEGDKPGEALRWMLNGHDQADGEMGTCSAGENMITRLEKAFGKEHQIVMRGKVLLAKGHHATGKKEEAIGIVKEVVETLGRTLGDRHAFTREVVYLARAWDPLAFLTTDDGAIGDLYDGSLSDDEGDGSLRRASSDFMTKTFPLGRTF